MPVIAIVSLVIQVACAVHCVRTGRETFWIYIIVFIPGLGCLVYFITQILPDLRYNRTVRSAQRRIGETINPHKDLRELRDQLEIADNVDNRVALADGLHEEARDLYQSCLKGPFTSDPHLLLKLAEAEFEQGRADRCKDHLESLIASNPEFRSVDGHLLYARSLETLGDRDKALEEYGALVDATRERRLASGTPCCSRKQDGWKKRSRSSARPCFGPSARPSITSARKNPGSPSPGRTSPVDLWVGGAQSPSWSSPGGRPEQLLCTRVGGRNSC